MKEIGFEINPCDPFLANMMIKSSQMNVCWNVDDLKVSHKEEGDIDVFVLKIFNIFVHGIKFSRGKVK